MNHSELEDLPDRIDDWGEFRKFCLQLARAAAGEVCAAAGIAFPEDADPLERSVVRAHMVRICKLLDSYLMLLEIGKTDTAPTLSRSIMEAVINLEYLLNSDDVAFTSRAFVCRSADRLLLPQKYLESQVVVPEDPDDPTESDVERFMESVGPLVELRTTASLMLQRAQLIDDAGDAESFLKSDAGRAYLKAWPAVPIGRVQTEAAKAVYHIWFARYSETTHLNWRALEAQDLWLSEAGEVRLEQSILEERDIIEPTGWCLDTAQRYAHMFSGNPAAADLEDQLSRRLQQVLAVDQLVRAEIERVVDELPDDVGDGIDGDGGEDGDV